MRCDQARQLLHELLDGDPSGRDPGPLREHVEHCAACAALLAALEALPQRMAALEAEPSAETEQRIAAGVRAALRPRAVGRPSWALAGAMATVALAIGLYAGRAAFPRELVRTAPPVVQRVVERVPTTKLVPVPVVRERVVIRPVVRYAWRREPPLGQTRAVVAEAPPAADRVVPARAEPTARPAGDAEGATFMVSHEATPAGAAGRRGQLSPDETAKLANALRIAVVAFEARSGVTELATGLERGFDALGGRLDVAVSAPPVSPSGDAEGRQ